MSLPATIADLRAGFAFYTRLPLAPPPGAANAMFALHRAAWVVPIVGATVGATAAVGFIGATALGLAPTVAGLVSVATLVLLTGALHEDGLADCADGFGGGTTRARKLEIMRDSRLGTYGVCALVLTLGLRVAALAQCAAFGWGGMLALLVAAGAVSRSAALWPLAALPPARADGAGASAGVPCKAALRLAGLLAVAAALPLAVRVGVAPVALAFVIVVVVAHAMTRLAERQIGGHTGDVVGAVQQLTEIAIYLALAAHVSG